jgi:hypothetical protein
MTAIGQQFGKTTVSALNLIANEIAHAERIRASLADNLTAVETQIQQYEAEAQARVVAENQARERRVAEQQRIVEQRAIANMSSIWPKSQCIRAINNFFGGTGTTFADARAIRAATLSLVSERLTACEGYSWTFEERKRLVIPLPFKDVEGQEQQWLTQMLNAKIVNFIKQRGLVEKFAWEVGHNTIVLSDSLGFINRHGLMAEFRKNDNLEFDELDRSNQAVGVGTHGTALLLGITK